MTPATRARLQGLSAKLREEARTTVSTRCIVCLYDCADRIVAALAAEEGDEHALRLCRRCARAAYVGLPCLNCGAAAVFARPTQSNCSCWIGRAEAYGGWAPDRITCKVHGDAALTRRLSPQEEPK